MASILPTLSSQVEIVDDKGRPTPYFTRLLAKLTAGGGLTNSNGQLALATMAAKTILANKTSGVASPTACTISDILDFVSATRGTILFRGASGWQALAPGTSGKLLQTNGAGADPTWVTPASGGGSTELTRTVPVLTDFTLQNTGAGRSLTSTTNGIVVAQDPTSAASNIVFASYNTAPGASFTLTARLSNGDCYTNGGYTTCLLLRNSSIGRMTIYGSYNGDSQPLIQQWGGYTSFNADVNSRPNMFGFSATFPWRRITLSGGTLNYWASPDGYYWTSLITNTAASYMTAAGGTIDQVGFGTYSNRSATICNSWTLV